MRKRPYYMGFSMNQGSKALFLHYPTRDIFYFVVQN